MNKQKGFTIIEVIIVVVIIGVLVTIAIPNLLSSRRAANEGSTIGNLRVLHGANVAFASTVGGGNYAGLAGTPGTSSLNDLDSAQLIDSALATGDKAGYTLIGDRTASLDPNGATFYFSANPTSISGITKTGTKRFGLATDGVLKADADEVNLGIPFDAAALETALTLNN